MTISSSASTAATAPIYSVVCGVMPTQEKVVVELWQQGGLGSGAELEMELKRLRWFYLNNPQGAAQTNLLCFSADASPVGCLAIAPRQFVVDGNAMTGGTLVDFVVNPKHRSAYPALTLQRAGRERALRAWDFVYGLPDTKAVAICKRLTSHVSFQLPRFVRVIRSRSYLERVMPSSLAAALSWIVDNVDRFMTRIRLLASRNKGEWLEELDARFDAIWSSFEKKSYCIGRRDREFLQWRFTAQPHHNYRVFAITNRPKEELRMYFVCEQLKHALIVKDCLNVGSEAELRDGLLWLSTAARKLGVNAIDLQISANELWRRALKRAHFALRSSRPFFATFREPLQQKAEGLEWYITQADEDI